MFVFARGVPRQQKDREDLADGVTATLAYVCTELCFKKLFQNAKRHVTNQCQLTWQFNVPPYNVDLSRSARP